jgi:hypothetical protein
MIFRIVNETTGKEVYVEQKNIIEWIDNNISIDYCYSVYPATQEELI